MEIGKEKIICQSFLICKKFYRENTGGGPPPHAQAHLAVQRRFTRLVKSTL